VHDSRSDGAPDWADHPDLVAYYETHRNQLSDLYPSERRFLPWLAASADSVLDVGCGAGGFAQAWRACRPSISYTGVDVSDPLVAAARGAHPEHEFLRADCAEGVPLADGYADVVSAMGWLHWEPRYADALAELWRLTGRYAFFDLRLVDGPGPDTSAVQRLALTADWDGRTTVPYICASWPRVAELLLGLEPARILAHGYWGRPADTVMGVDSEICFATFVLERGERGRCPEVALDLPLQWPRTLSDRVRLAGPERLDEIVGAAEGAHR
jgi:SAM-dependent methyltransferase